MRQVNQALSENTRYTQLGDGRWKAEYNGFVKMTAEGQTPTQSEVQLNRAMDTLLASLIRGGKDREKADPDAFISSLMLSDAICVVMKTAKESARFKKGAPHEVRSESKASEEREGQVAAPKSRRARKRR